MIREGIPGVAGLALSMRPRTLAPFPIFEPSGKCTSCMTVPLIVWAGFAFPASSVLFNITGRTVPEGISWANAREHIVKVSIAAIERIIAPRRRTF